MNLLPQTVCGLYPQTLSTIPPSTGQNKCYGNILLHKTSVISIMVGHFDYKHPSQRRMLPSMCLSMPLEYQTMGSGTLGRAVAFRQSYKALYDRNLRLYSLTDQKIAHPYYDSNSLNVRSCKLYNIQVFKPVILLLTRSIVNEIIRKIIRKKASGKS